jgi:hypothetical protein
VDLGPNAMVLAAQINERNGGRLLSHRRSHPQRRINGHVPPGEDFDKAYGR